ncbi:SAM-dependent methyltransferase [Streptosporangium becharense]|uniref:SAM-dependent methyltransferase n=1 Tax=Streptosporangium becharense TaxID=1816182 RepID=A0A7W9IG52_9ACTN|nr:methyltransferase domain-containing protein [Streptosporangium becharense]MBB2908868.1 SAM-dependent methyltransferase [Streptosporangium becharense]MBB5820114.1 SAM-dependent methyltransferase [Streptosporangium becharense]
MAAEILQLGLGTITRLGHREVHFCTRRPEPRTVRLRTADDVFLLAARSPDVGPARADVAGLAGLAAVADTETLLRHRQDCGGSGELTGVEVSASFLGRRNFNRYDAEDAVGLALSRRLGVGYHPRRGGSAPPAGHSAWRLTLDGTRATLMLRIADRPLHRRAYKLRTIPGTLHPPVAAAMAGLADIRPEHRVLDPCCGAGTLLVEAGALQPEARLHGFDLDPDALRAARANAAGSPAVTLRPADAGDLPLPDGSVDRVVCNPPWGAQVDARGLLGAAPSRWWGELRRVLVPDGMAVVLIPDADDLATAIRQRLTPVHLQQVRLSGARSYIIRLMVRQRDR